MCRTIKDREYDRYSELSPREQTPERSARNTLPQPYSPTERFRRYPPVQDYREPYPYSHNRSDSYRSLQERGSWNPPYYPQEEYTAGFESTPRPIPNNARFPGRSRRRQRAVSGGSFHDTASSPIRTRTNLPDRLDINNRFSPEFSPRESLMKRIESRPVSPIAHTHSRSRSTSHSPRFEQDRVEEPDIHSRSPRHPVQFDLGSMSTDTPELGHTSGHRAVTLSADTHCPQQPLNQFADAVRHRQTDESLGMWS